MTSICNFVRSKRQCLQEIRSVHERKHAVGFRLMDRKPKRPICNDSSFTVGTISPRNPNSFRSLVSKELLAHSFCSVVGMLCCSVNKHYFSASGRRRVHPHEKIRGLSPRFEVK